MDAHRATFSLDVGMPLPNIRLKLAGALVLREAVVFVSWRALTVVHRPCAGGRVARSLSAIR